MLRNVHPVFNETSERSGAHKQQDADEALALVLGSYRQALRKADPDNEDLVGDLFEIELETTHTNTEDPTEVSTQRENVLKLTCQIENGPQSASSLSDGLKIAFAGEIEKNSDNLGRNAVWSKTSKINRLVSAR